MTTSIEERRTDTRRHERTGSTPSAGRRFSVVVAGGGPAAVEASLAIRRIAGDRVTITVVAPERLVHLPLPVLSPFAAGDRVRLALDELPGVNLIQARLLAVDPSARELQTSDGRSVPYDALLVAVGGVPRPPLRRALAFGLPGSDERMHGLVQDVEDGYVKRVAFVVPVGGTWPLPVYELALMTAARAYDMCDSVELTLVTPEPAPLAVFGEAVSRDVARLLSEAGITLKAGARAKSSRPGRLELRPSGEELEVDRVVTVPVLDGHVIAGLPCDEVGFLPVDAHGRVPGAPGVYGAGDVTNFAIKQGGIACQQADVAAEAIAAAAGVDIEPAPFEPVLRALLRTQCDSLWMERRLGRGSGATDAGTPRTKLAGRELSRLLPDVAGRAA